MHLVVGLGNPGREYERNRHNLGFMVVDALAQAYGLGDLRSKYGGLFSRGVVGDEEIALLKPQTFMNLSGESVQAAAAWLKITPGNVIVVHDELDLPWTTIRVKLGGGHAGHNGLRSVIQHLGSTEFARIRVGIGRPPVGFVGDVSDWVLSNFDSAERAELDGVVDTARSALSNVLRTGVQEAARALPGRVPSKAGD